MFKRLYTLGFILCFLALSSQSGNTEGKHNFGINAGTFDLTDESLYKYYGDGYIISMSYEYIHISGLGVKTFAALSRNEKYMFNSQNKKNIILYRYPAGVVATYRPSVDKWSLSPYIGFGYALIYTYEQIGEPIEEFREERVYESFSYGYVMEVGLEYHFNKNVTFSFQSQLITSKVIYKEEYVNFGGYATTLGITYGF